MRGSTIIEWTSLRPDLWDAVPGDLITWCMHIGGAPLADVVSILAASNRATLMLHAADLRPTT